jgi:hypothetical protein
VTTRVLLRFRRPLMNDEWGVQINYCTVRQLLQGLNVHVGDIDSVLLDGTRPFFTLD